MKIFNLFGAKSSVIFLLEYIYKNVGVQRECDITEFLNGILSNHQSHHKFLEEVQANGFIKITSMQDKGLSSYRGKTIKKKSIAKLTLVGESHLKKYNQDILTTFLVLISASIGLIGVITTVILSN